MATIAASGSHGSVNGCSATSAEVAVRIVQPTTAVTAPPTRTEFTMAIPAYSPTGLLVHLVDPAVGGQHPGVGARHELVEAGRAGVDEVQLRHGSRGPSPAAVTAARSRPSGGASEAAVRKHVGNIFAKLDLDPASDRRVSAVLAYLRG